MRLWTFVQYFKHVWCDPAEGTQSRKIGFPSAVEIGREDSKAVYRRFTRRPRDEENMRDARNLQEKRECTR